MISAIHLQVIVSGLLIGAVYALFASGLTLIWGMMNVINFAHGDFVMLAMYTAFVVWTLFGGGPAASVPIASVVLATIGVLSYFLLVRHVMKGPMLAQILGTFGLALLLRYSAFWYFGANFKTLPDNLLGPPFVICCPLGSERRSWWPQDTKRSLTHQEPSGSRRIDTR